MSHKTVITYCKECNATLYDGTTLFGNTHYCLPTYEYLDTDNWDWENEAGKVSASNYQQAAEEAAEQIESRRGEYCNELTLLVRKAGETDVRKFTVYAEQRIIYSAREQK